MSAWIRMMKSDGTVVTFDIRKMPSKGLTNARIIERDGLMLAVSANGILYGSGSAPTRSAAYIGFSWGWIPRLAYCLRFLGLITPEDEQATLEAHRLEKDLQERDYEISRIRNAAGKLGLDVSKLPASWRKKYPELSK